MRKVLVLLLSLLTLEVSSQKLVESIPLEMKSFKKHLFKIDDVITTHFEDKDKGTVDILVMTNSKWHLLKLNKELKVVSDKEFSYDNYQGDFLGAIKNGNEIVTFYAIGKDIYCARILPNRNKIICNTICNTVNLFYKKLGALEYNSKIYYILASKSKSLLRIYELSDKLNVFDIKFDKKKIKSLFKGRGHFTNKLSEPIRVKNSKKTVGIMFASGTKKIYPTEIGFDIVVDYKNKIDVLSVNLNKKSVEQRKIKVDDFSYLKGKYNTNSFIHNENIFYLTTGKKILTVCKIDKNGEHKKEIFRINYDFDVNYSNTNFISNYDTYSLLGNVQGDIHKKGITYRMFIKKMKNRRFGLFVNDYDSLNYVIHLGAINFKTSSVSPFDQGHMNQFQNITPLRRSNGPCPAIEIRANSSGLFGGLDKKAFEREICYSRFLVSKNELEYITSKDVKPSIYSRYNSLVKSMNESYEVHEYVRYTYLFKFNEKYYMSFYSKIDGKKTYNVMTVDE